MTSKIEILKKVKAREDALTRKLRIVMDEGQYRRRCVDARICPKCGGTLTYNENKSIWGWFIPSLSRSTCDCNACGFQWVFRSKIGIGLP